MKKSKRNGKNLSQTSLKERGRELKEVTFHDLGDTGHPHEENDSEYYDHTGKF